MKLIWELFAEPQNFWIRIINEKYPKNINVFYYQKNSNTSWYWSKLMELRRTFWKGTIWQVGDGDTIKFRIDNWVFDTPLIEMVNLPNEVAKEEKMEKYLNINKTWNRNRLEQILPISLVETITNIAISDHLFQRQNVLAT